MSEIITKKASFPTDDDGFCRRECPYCKREFKIEPTDTSDCDNEKEFFCPYCMQLALGDQWWTQEQLNYIRKIAENTAADIINEQLIRPLSRSSGSSSIFKIETKEITKHNEIIPPEMNDMKIVDLPCCGKRMKIDETWASKYCCFYCGFEHNQ